MDGRRLKAAREAAKKTQTQLAELLSVTQNSIWRWEKNMSEPDDKKKKELANILNVSVAYLMGETAPETDTEETTVNYLWVPVVEIEACAGNGNEYPEYCITTVDTRPISKTDLIGHSWQNSGYKIFSIAGDSMEPRFSDGDDVLVSIDENLTTGNIILAWWHGKLYIRGYINQGNKIVLKPLNPKYSQIEIEHGDTDLYIIGKVIARVPKIEKVESIY